ncbi:ABC transporter ATP-binding protein [Salinirubellus salinus]|uniref:ABC transporter ATP-binding protein n=1 Tax=Salinirubellus salinus TaxID=1364945 RepID=A0A9E7UC24_9EURY|nr:ABC transporter ATP-binding protein [Salinirubellus salinus]UWM55294.1 ABC transporter ATP-binding protein [Salinirubellus salinus]
MSLLEVDSIDAYYGQSHILRDLSMEIADGEVCALLGRNGAGKTTTLRSIAGAAPPDVRDGEIRFEGKTIAGRPTEDVSMSGIGLVPEERRIFPNLTVEENLHLAEVSRNRSNLVGRALGQVNEARPLQEMYDAFPRLDERQNQMAGTLSGGEQQMLAIARALRQNPKLLMLDEPYEGLAPKIIEDVEDAIRRISEEGTTVLLVEQNAAAAIKIAERCYIVDQGSIVYEGHSEDLREDEETRQRYLGV